MKVLAWLATAVPAFMAGASTGRVVASLGAPTPVPLAAAIATAVIALIVLDSLIDTLIAHRAANRG
ncbi:hypothetical protein [Streptomyces sp. NPDC056817]|uniref:hypothetical protein n=1 Tax=Streptomyces sp. NPDC056817 TaxID=3345950 RepID=UPI0036ABDA73